MNRSTRWVINLTYYYSQLLGIIAFSYNVETGVARKKAQITVYCLFANLMTLSCVPYFGATMKIKPRLVGQRDLQQKMYVFMILVRVVGVLVTIFSNWLRREDFICNLNDFQRYREKFLKKWSMRKKYQDYFEHRVRAKVCIGLVCEIMMSLSTVGFLRDTFEVDNPLILTSLALLSTVLNTVTCHFYFVALHVHLLFFVIAGEVKVILNTIGDLFRLQYLKRIKPGAFVTQCCYLSDALDDLAQAHLELQGLGDRINQMYYVQGCCLVLVLYMNNVCLIYMGYTMSQQEDQWPQFEQRVGILVVVVMCFYYVDAYLFVILILNMVETIDMPRELLKDRQPWLPTLDERLERSLQMFSIQMAAFPFNRQLLYLFEITRPMVFATISSTVSNAIVLMQYDYKYSVN